MDLAHAECKTSLRLAMRTGRDKKNIKAFTGALFLTYWNTRNVSTYSVWSLATVDVHGYDYVMTLEAVLKRIVRRYTLVVFKLPRWVYS